MTTSNEAISPSTHSSIEHVPEEVRDVSLVSKFRRGEHVTVTALPSFEYLC